MSAWVGINVAWLEPEELRVEVIEDSEGTLPTTWSWVSFGSSLISVKLVLALSLLLVFGKIYFTLPIVDI